METIHVTHRGVTLALDWDKVKMAPIRCVLVQEALNEYRANSSNDLDALFDRIEAVLRGDHDDE